MFVLGSPNNICSTQEDHICLLFCRYIIQKQKDPERAHQVKMDSVLKALRWLNIDMDIDEVFCVANLLPSSRWCSLKYVKY